MINSHLLYRLSYRGTELRTTSKSVLASNSSALSLLRPAILHSSFCLSTPICFQVTDLQIVFRSLVPPVICVVPDSGAYIRGTRFSVQAFFQNIQLVRSGPEKSGVCVTEQLRRQAQRRKAETKSPAKAGLFLDCRAQAKTISSPSTLAVIAAPGRNCPPRINCASGFSIQRWIARLSGRAPYTGS